MRNGTRVTVANGFNIYGSTGNDATLTLVERDGHAYALLTADMGRGRETAAVYAEKLVYAQPHVWIEVLRKAVNGLRGRGQLE